VNPDVVCRSSTRSQRVGAAIDPTARVEKPGSNSSASDRSGHRRHLHLIAIENRRLPVAEHRGIGESGDEDCDVVRRVLRLRKTVVEQSLTHRINVEERPAD